MSSDAVFKAFVYATINAIGNMISKGEAIDAIDREWPKRLPATWQDITRLTVVDEKGGRVLERWDHQITPSVQDDGKTLKLFISERAHATRNRTG